jgi:hypothetical protein
MSLRNRITEFVRNVAFSGVQFATSARLLGRASSGAGDGQEISLGTGLGFTGMTLNVTLVAGADYLTPGGAAAAYQPLDSDLTAIAALSTTTYGRSFLTLADESAARDFLKILSIPTAPVSGFGGVSFNATAVAYHTLTGNSTVTFTDLAPGKVVEVLITEPNGSGWGINWPAGVTWLPGAPGNPTPLAPKYLRLISTTSSASGVIGLVLSN